MKRYNLEEQQYGSGHMVYWDKSMVEDAEGEWVKHSDLAAPSAANGAVGEMPELPVPDGDWAGDEWYTKDRVQEIVRAAVLAERNACADIVNNADSPDCGGWNMNHIAERIRART